MTNILADTADRFIVNRKNLNMDYLNYRLLYKSNASRSDSTHKSSDRLSNQEVSDLSKIEYDIQLKSVLHMNQQRLPFVSVPPANYSKSVLMYDEIAKSNEQWPVKRRPYPMTKNQMSVLDLPNLKKVLFGNLMDWSSSDHLIAALDKQIWLWHYPTAKMSDAIACRNEAIAVKSNIDSSKLFFSYQNSQFLEIYNMSTKQHNVVMKNPIGCKHSTCWISAIDFHPFNKYIVIGCHKGNMAMLDADFTRIVSITNAHGSTDVAAIKCSPDGRYVASTGRDGYINIWTIPDYALIYSYHHISVTRGVSWHPWRSSYLCVGCGDGTLMLIHAAQGKCLYTKRFPDIHIYDITFNKCTAELVIAQHSVIEDYRPELTVLSDFNQVVDRFLGHCGEILYLTWSPDNTILASASMDETIRLWKFNTLSKKLSKDLNSPKTKNKTNSLNFMDYIR